MDMRDYINNWEGSDRYKRLKKEYEEAKAKIINLDFQAKDFNKVKATMTRKELIEFIKHRMINHTYGDNADVEWINEILCSSTTKEEIYYSFITTMVTWYMYLIAYEKIEDYEMCDLLWNDAILLEEEDLLSILKAKFGSVPPEELEYIQNIHKTCRAQFE